jgi:hypothetical protein
MYCAQATEQKQDGKSLQTGHSSHLDHLNMLDVLAEGFGITISELTKGL